MLAHMTGAALIEPCVHKSRLVACDVAQSKGYNRVLVSDLFDVPALSTFATIVPPDDANCPPPRVDATNRASQDAHETT